MRVRRTTNLRAGRIHLHILPVLVWLAAVACVGFLFTRQTQHFEVVGIARGQMRQVAASRDGVLKMVSVELFEKVRKGQILAMLDDKEINASIETAAAEINHLMSQLVPTQDSVIAEAAERESDYKITKRRYALDVENVRVRMLELKTVIETDRITLENLGLEVRIAEHLLEEQAIAPYELQKSDALYDTLAKKIKTNEHLMLQYQADLDNAQKRSDQLAANQPYHRSAESALEPILEEIKVKEKLVDELLTQRKSFIIRSPIDGIVVRINGTANELSRQRPGESLTRWPGEVVLAGEPILVVAENGPREVVAYAKGEHLDKIKDGMTVELIKNGPPAQIASSQVTGFGPAMEMMPERLWLNPNMPQWGRPIVIKIPPGMQLLPGELVGVRGI